MTAADIRHTVGLLYLVPVSRIPVWTVTVGNGELVRGTSHLGGEQDKEGIMEQDK